jgi:DNA repair exonuclease SbcCD nuclease subunit
MKILHTADIHLREYDDERWKTLEKIIEIGKREKVEIFVISGDLFDKGIDAENLRPKIREIFSNTGFKIYIIPGNHDRDSYKPGMYFGDDVDILTDLNSPFNYKDLIIWGMPYEPIEGEKILNSLNLLANNLNPNKKNILLYHGELLDAFFSRRDFGDEGEERYMPVKLSYFKDLNIDYILAGHFHKNFDMWKLENGGYFIYPGSPISITKRETGQRKINIFELGKSPNEYILDTPHYEEVDINFDPFKDKKPIEIVKDCFNNLHPKAKVILKVGGFINSEDIGMSEKELVKQIKEISSGKCDEDHYEFKDIRIILEDDLFKNFREKLEHTDYEEEKKRQMREIAIRAMMETQS